MAQFATTYTPHFAVKALARQDDLGAIALSEKAPSLALIRKEQGAAATALWIGEHLRSLSDYAGQGNGLTEQQIAETSHLLLAKYFYLNAAEFAIFFAKFKLGEYGRFYGTVDPIAINEAFIKFLGERREAIAKTEAKREAERRERMFEGCITYEQWQAMKPQIENKAF